MLVRYRYRIDPTAAQRQALARAFGCARVVYNDAIVERQRAYQAGERLSDTEVQRRGRQSIRLTRNGFAFRGTRLYVAKVGQVRVRWSRALPLAPSSVTVIREPDGRYYASFVVDRDPTPLPPMSRTAGIDLGLVWFATIVASDGNVETIANPRYLRTAMRRLVRAQRQLSRKEKGSRNRAKARLRVAVAHRKVRDQRADHHHKLALRLIRENQAVAVEDLAVAGLARTRLAKSVHDAGWTMFVRLLEAKAAQHGRQVVKVGRWVPTSQTCSVCEYRDGPKPLSIRAWACWECGAVHDRDVNAARNILVAAGLAETLNACGGHVSPGATLAVASEAGTRRGAA